jgi:hypothetical protein
MDRTLWGAEFTASGQLPWTCPSCEGGRLFIVPNSLRTGQTRTSADGQQHEASEPEWVDGRFACMVACHHCTGAIAVAGKFRFQDDRFHDEVLGESGDYERYFSPSFFSEPPNIIQIPEETPDRIRERLVESFRLYWNDPESALNRIRSALELLLTAQRVNRTAGRGKGRPRGRFLTLHDRIQKYSLQRPDLAEPLLAAKWLGNAGSHATIISRNDVLDAYELLEHVLDELYVRRSHRVGALSRAINRRRGPRSARKPSGA